MKQAKIVLVGIGGYGANYVAFLKDRQEKGLQDFVIEGIVDPFAEKSRMWEWVKEQGFPVYQTVEAFYAEKSADLAMIATPIPLHRPQSVYAMEHGSHVIVEKPLCPTIQDAQLLEETSRRTGKFLAVGFQWSFSKPMLDLKQDILDGKLGKLLSMKGFVSWKRFLSYYNHTWKGKYHDDKGNWILDCVITNATAHYLHNLFFVAGASLPDAPALDKAAMPCSVLAESYRVKPDMETPDIFALRGTLPGEIPFWFASSYSLRGDQTTRFEYAYENALIRFNEDENDNMVRVAFKDGTEKVYGDPQCTEECWRKMEKALRATLTGDFSEITCKVSTIMPHLKVTDGMFDLIPNQPINERYLEDEQAMPGNPDSDHGIFAHTIRDDLLLCYAQMKLPSELGYTWACPAVAFEPAKIERFDGSRFL